MNKNAIKKFAIEARKKLIASVSDRAGMLGITPEGCSESLTRGVDFEVYKTVAGTEITLNKNQCRQRRKLKEQIEARGFEAVVEEVAYTWFNRICAIRFMEVNDYLPTRVRVLSSEKEGKNEPDIVTQAPDVDLDFTDKEREYILDCKMNNKLDELFKMLFIKQCNKLSEILPELFEATEDYTEMLLNISYTNKDDVISMLVHPDTGIPESDFNVSTIREDGQPTGQVEIIGWLYQYYNTELKDDTFAQLKKNVKISKERIPAATQLFTPDWIVRYMVENSVGRLWIEHLRALDPEIDEKETAEKFGWKYYLPEAEQEADVNVQLAEIRTSYKDLKPEDITCIDPCMGSGHILVAMFDVLMDIYKSAGYSERDAAFKIVEHNLHGLDIDKRAYQLAYFAVMMKGRGYNRRFFSGKQNEEGERVAVQPQVYVIEESNGVNRAHLKYFGADLNEVEKNDAVNQMNGLLDELRDATEYGSLINVINYNWNLLMRFALRESSEGQINFDSFGIDETQTKLKRLVEIGRLLSEKYYAVVTNPPYMGNGNMNSKLTEYAVISYTDSKLDMFAMMIERSINFACQNGYFSLITMHSWMFLASFQKLREKMLNKTTSSILHLGSNAFGTDVGTIVQSVAFVCKNNYVINNYTKFIRLVDFNSSEKKMNEFYNPENIYEKKNESFVMVPGCPMAYWVSNEVLEVFSDANPLSYFGDARSGLQTSDNNRFLRLWFEVDRDKIGLGYSSAEEAKSSHKKWFPHTKGGSFRKWYGNFSYVVNWYNDGEEIKTFATDLYKSYTRIVKNTEYYFEKGITWSHTATKNHFGVRYVPEGIIFNVEAPTLFRCLDMEYMMGLLNSQVANLILPIMNQTMHFLAGDTAKFPTIIDKSNDDEIKMLVSENIQLSKMDWDEQEISWDFKVHPLIRMKGTNLRDAINRYIEIKSLRMSTILKNEQRLDEIYIKIYGFEKENLPMKTEEDITLLKLSEEDMIKSFLSYAIGCMFGRYSLDTEGLVCTSNCLDMKLYDKYSPSKDNIIIIGEEDYFEDDIFARLSEFLNVLYGEDELENNIDFIASVLKSKGATSKEIIKNYFLSEFYKNHCEMYSVTGSGKRPIYWLFDSGKENGFKALMYLHRYDKDCVGVARIEYLHKMQNALERAMERAEYVRENANGSEKAKATRELSKYIKKLTEIKQYDEAMAHLANQRIELDLDDGVKVNYEKFQGVEVAQEGKKALKVDLLAKIK